jgi:hypothetical protein
LKQSFRSAAWSLFLAGLLSAALLAGCTTRQDPDEVLSLCGNHTCGTLTMVTSDTSSDGYQYLEPSLSPDGQRIAFTADFMSLPPQTHDLPDPPPTSRQIMIVPVHQASEPLARLAENGTQLVDPRYTNIDVGGLYQEDLRLHWKNSPNWIDDNTLLCSIDTQKRGNRLFRIDLTVTPPAADVVYYEPDDALEHGDYWEHLDPDVSQDKHWVVFSRFGFELPDSLQTYTNQSLWVVNLAEGEDAPQPRAFPLTREIALIRDPAWSPDGSKIAFSASLDLVEESAALGTEIFTIDFDTTGLAQNGGVPLERNLQRVTYSSTTSGDPLDGIDNYGPCFTADGSEIIFVSNRRAPSITLHSRDIWRVPTDGRLEPEILFFSREDDVDPFISPDRPGDLFFSSSMGFPTEMLDRLEAQYYDEAIQEGMLPHEAVVEAADKRQELEYFARVMSHIYIFSGWQ